MEIVNGKNITKNMNSKFSKISSIKKVSVEKTYDFAVQDTHRIIAREEGTVNGFYTSNCWHPDIEEFITAKQTPGRLTKFNMSVLITDDFMKAVENDEEWDLIFPDIESEEKIPEGINTVPPTKFMTVKDVYKKQWNGNIKEWKEKGHPIKIHKTIKAKELWDLIMNSTYTRNEPGVLFYDTINRLNNLQYCEHINATNPCVTGDTLVSTDKGDITMKILVEKIKSGENINVLSFNLETKEKEFKSVEFADRTRENANIIQIELDNGSILNLTPDHLVYTLNRGYVKASLLNDNDEIVIK
jgi:ribonucleotide reductase alpha subunit